jgi:heterodisulfide reductase subunit C
MRFDPELKKEISKAHGGEAIKLCYQCGICSGGCPISRILPAHSPRRIIEMALLGMRNEVIKSEEIWLCTTCYTCHERCPQGVHLTDVLNAIRNIAVREGHVPQKVKEAVLFLLETGRTTVVTSATDRIREGLGLSKLPSIDLDEIRKIIEKTGVEKLLKGE